MVGFRAGKQYSESSISKLLITKDLLPQAKKNQEENLAIREGAYGSASKRNIKRFLKEKVC